MDIEDIANEELTKLNNYLREKFMGPNRETCSRVKLLQWKLSNPKKENAQLN
jgi:hypothetical protein